jgi:hypothetical protein
MGGRAMSAARRALAGLALILAALAGAIATAEAADATPYAHGCTITATGHRAGYCPRPVHPCHTLGRSTHREAHHMHTPRRTATTIAALTAAIIAGCPTAASADTYNGHTTFRVTATRCDGRTVTVRYPTFLPAAQRMADAIFWQASHRGTTARTLLVSIDPLSGVTVIEQKHDRCG